MAISGIKLRCPLEKCSTLKTVAPSGGYEAGQFVQVNDIVGVVVEAKDAGEDVVVVYQAPKILVPCAPAATAGYAVGEKVYADIDNNQVAEESSGTVLCGVVTEPSSVGDTEVEIHLDGMLAITS